MGVPRSARGSSNVPLSMPSRTCNPFRVVFHWDILQISRNDLESSSVNDLNPEYDSLTVKSSWQRKFTAFEFHRERLSTLATLISTNNKKSIFPSKFEFIIAAWTLNLYTWTRHFACLFRREIKIAYFARKGNWRRRVANYRAVWVCHDI